MKASSSLSNKQVVQNEQLQLLLNRCGNLTLFQKKHWVALISVDGIGPSTFYSVVNYLNKNRRSWQDFWVNKGSIWHKIGLKESNFESIQKFKSEHTISSYWNSLKSKSISVIAITQNKYPYLLKQIYDPPPILFVKGDIGLVQKLPIAIVGTRKMTAYGRVVTQKIATELSSNEACIVSGFMYGVDLLAQQSAVKAGGCTAGVLGYGFDHAFPASHKIIMNEMIKTKKAVFISEYAPFVQPNRGTFPRRNRIIAGLSLGVVVTEAGERSGTQITVSYALDFGRDVFAVSGPVTSPYHEGVKKMINNGAQLVGSGTEVINNLSARNWGRDLDLAKRGTNSDGLSCSTSREYSSSLNLTETQLSVVKEIQVLPLTTSELAAQLELDHLQVINCLTKLEVQGLVKRDVNQWQLAN